MILRTDKRQKVHIRTKTNGLLHQAKECISEGKYCLTILFFICNQNDFIIFRPDLPVQKTTCCTAD